ncbi:MAG TPA: hypothetical protein VH415_06040 [Nitrososphaeraceae archaeon]|jgi:hypothetical protein
MENVKEEISKVGSKIGDKVLEDKSEWAELVSQLVDKLTGKDLAITYEFDDLQVDIPKATGPGGKEIGSAKWEVNGKLVISTAVEDKSKFRK